MKLKLSNAERMLIRDLVGLDSRDRCPVVLVDDPCSPNLIGETGHYIDSTGTWIYTAEEMYRAGKRRRTYIASTRAIEVGNSWLAGYRVGCDEYVKREHR